MATINVTDGDTVKIRLSDTSWCSLNVTVHDTVTPRALWDRDIRSELDTHSNPTNPPVWWVRKLDQIDALTFHHTLSDSPHATFSRYVKTKKRPTGPYTLWITQTGEALLCVDLELGVWHDHTGFSVGQDGKTLWGNSHLSVGLAGKLHQYAPADVQLERAAQLVADAILSPMLPTILSIDQIKGHRDLVATICPGWASVQSGHWRARLFDAIGEKLAL